MPNIHWKSQAVAVSLQLKRPKAHLGKITVHGAMAHAGLMSLVLRHLPSVYMIAADWGCPLGKAPRDP